MKYNHHIISDILPLYADGVCSEESAIAVREHLAECEECRMVLDDLETGFSIEPPHLDGAEVFKKTGRKIALRATRNIIGISVIVFYWIIYAIMTPFANVGDYRFFPYALWEIWSIGSILIPVFNLIWLITIIVKNIKQKEWRNRFVIFLVVAMLFICQIGIAYVRAHEVSTLTVGWVEKVNMNTFVFNNGEETLTVSCSYELTGVLKADGTMYVVSYQHNRLFPGKARLSDIEEAGYHRSESSWAAEQLPN